MISDRNKTRLAICTIYLVCTFAAMNIASGQKTVYRFQANGQVQKHSVLQVNPQTLFSQGVNFAGTKTGNVIKSIPLMPAVSIPAATAAFELPESYWARIPATGTVIELKPVVVLGAPMKYEPATKDFRGSLCIYLREVGQTASRPLSVPLRVLVATNADRVVPKSLGFGHTYFPPEDVQVISGNPQDVVKVRFMTEIDTSGYDVDLVVEPSLTIQTGQTRLQAYGVEKASLVITRRPAVATSPSLVSVTATSGSVNPESLDLGSGQATVSVRSSGIGKSVVTVVGSGYRSAQAELEYVFPSAFLIATLLGSACGAFLSKKGKNGSRQFLRRILVGVIVVAAWVILGLNLLNIPLPTYYNEGLAFVLGSLGAWSFNLKNPLGPVQKKNDSGG